MIVLNSLILVILMVVNGSIQTLGTVTTDPNRACVGDSITVSCTLDVPNSANDGFDSVRTDFIVGDSDIEITEAFVDGTGTHGGVDLSKLMATANPGTRTSVEGTITLLSYSPEDNGIRLGCANEYFIDGDTSDIGTVSESTAVLQAAVPSTPNNINTDISSLSSDCTNTLVSWTAPATTDRPIDRYYLYRNSSLLAVTTDTQYTDTDQLSVNTLYEYSVIANSCAGNSSEGVGNSVIPGLSLTSNSPLILTFDNTDSTLTVGWGLSPYTASIRPLSYSLHLIYSHSQSETTHYYSSTLPLYLLSNVTTHSLSLQPHGLSPYLPVATNITVCLQIVQQCGYPYTESLVCGLYNTEYTLFPSSTITTTPTTTTSTSTTNVSPPVSTHPTNTPSPASSAQLLASLIILVIIILLVSVLSITIISILVVVIVVMYRKIKHLQSLCLPTQPPHPYEYIDLNTAVSADTAAIPSPHKDSAYYTAMHSAVSLPLSSQGAAPPPPPTYANLK